MSNTTPNRDYAKEIKSLRKKIDNCTAVIKRKEAEREDFQTQLHRLNREHNAPFISYIMDTITDESDKIDFSKVSKENIANSILNLMLGKEVVITTNTPEPPKTDRAEESIAKSSEAIDPSVMPESANTMSNPSTESDETSPDVMTPQPTNNISAFTSPLGSVKPY